MLGLHCSVFSVIFVMISYELQSHLVRKLFCYCLLVTNGMRIIKDLHNVKVNDK